MNKKLIKSLVGITCGLGVVAAIPLATTSCGLPQGELPESVYRIENNILKGFTDEFLANKDNYNCNTMQIPARVTEIASDAFYDESSDLSKIPPFIKNLTFAEGSDLTTIGGNSFTYALITSVDFTNCTKLIKILSNAFYSCSLLTSIDLSNCTESTTIADTAFEGCSSLTSVTFPSSLNTIEVYAFYDCSSLSSIVWEGLNGAPSIGSNAFTRVASSGTVKSTGSITSAELLDTLKRYGNLPTGEGTNWIAA